MTILVPVVTNHFDGVSPNVGGTGLGDTMALVKYRFFSSITIIQRYVHPSDFALENARERLQASGTATNLQQSGERMM